MTEEKRPSELVVAVPRTPYPQPPPTPLPSAHYGHIREVLGFWWDRLSTQERFTLYALAEQHFGLTEPADSGGSS